MTGEVDLPPTWVARMQQHHGDEGPSGSEWVSRVPALIREALSRWGLTLDGAPMTGVTALVLPVLAGSTPLALKVGWPHREARLEHVALRRWGGLCAVRLVRADPALGLLLLERLDPARDLRSKSVEDACGLAGTLLASLNVPAGAQFDSLQESLPAHLEQLAANPAVPRRIVARTLGLARELTADPDPGVLLHTDLHYENVLAGAGRADAWFAIDPKPLVGHRGWELLPLLRNRTGELDGRSFRTAIRRRVAITAEAAGMDVDEAVAWSLLRVGIQLGWTYPCGGVDHEGPAARAGRSTDTDRVATSSIREGSSRVSRSDSTSHAQERTLLIQLAKELDE